jgi:hypothetical protein
MKYLQNRSFLRLLPRFTRLAVTASVLASAAVPAHSMDAGERVKAKQLVNYIETMEGAVFIRNGREYTAANAAQFMRLKCESKMNTLKTAREFVDQCFSRSSESGKAYQIRTPDGKLYNSGDFLMQRLQVLESGGVK